MIIAFRVSPEAILVTGSEAKIPAEFIDCEVSDFKPIATLGMGGFGKVELVCICYCTKKNMVEIFLIKLNINE